jgi:hypothetical protein
MGSVPFAKLNEVKQIDHQIVITNDGLFLFIYRDL